MDERLKVNQLSKLADPAGEELKNTHLLTELTELNNDQLKITPAPIEQTEFNNEQLKITPAPIEQTEFNNKQLKITPAPIEQAERNNEQLKNTSLPFELAELDKAVRYQQWIISTIEPYLGKRILEFGSGIGNMSRWLKNRERLILTEGEKTLFHLLKSRIDSLFPNQSTISIYETFITNKLLDSFQHENLDTIVSFNVIEHIENDIDILQQCATLLRNSKTKEKKRIISFVPAHSWAYGETDKAVGHYRRYNRKMLANLHAKIMPDAKLILKPFNFSGLWGWILNGRLLKRKKVGTGSITLYEQLCPLFKLIDHILIGKLQIPLGQSLIAIHEW